MSHQYPQPVPPSRQTQGEPEFDPNLLLTNLQLLGQAPSFCPDPEEPSHKRTHEQMQQMPPVRCQTLAALNSVPSVASCIFHRAISFFWRLHRRYLLCLRLCIIQMFGGQVVLPMASSCDAFVRLWLQKASVYCQAT